MSNFMERNSDFNHALDTISDAYNDAEMEVQRLKDENTKLHADQAHWELGNCPNCPNVTSLQEALEQNTKLRELIADCMLMPSAYGKKYDIEPNFIVCSNHWGDRARALGIEV